MDRISISYQAIDSALWEIERRICREYGISTAYRDMDPLKWYINTGRASADFLRKLMSARSYMIARKLHQGGSTEAVISRIKSYIGYKEEA